MTIKRIVIVGASLAGLRAAETLRAAGFDGRLVMLGAEPHLPYDRPPLSKELLKDELAPDAVFFHPSQWYREQDIDVRLGCPATGLDLANRQVQCAGASGIGYDGLIIATGSRARTFPSMNGLAGVFTVRTLDDSLGLREALQPGTRVVVVGAGFIGAEVASSARSKGLEVTIVEAAATPLQRALGATMGSALGGLHAEHGVELRCGVGVARLQGADRVTAVELSDGTILPADVVVVGVGVVPNIEWLEGAGLQLGNGLLCDPYLNAGPDNVYAAGDVVCCANPWLAGPSRGEQWTTAADQGKVAAKNLLMGPDARQAYVSAPYFWSDQYGVRVQSIGRTTGSDLRVVVGAPTRRPFVGTYEENGVLVGAIAVNAPRQFAKLRPLVARRAASGEIVEALNLQ